MFTTLVQNLPQQLNGNKKKLISFVYMKNLILTLFLLFALTSIIAQEKVEVSKKIEYIGDKAYRIHTIAKGQTLYSISKAYNISIERIQKDNPETKGPLSLGQIIKIYDKSLKIPKDNNEKDIEFIEHIVSKQETTYGISKKYNVSIDDILKYNPEVKDGLSNGKVIRIPIKKIIKTERQDIVIKKDSAKAIILPPTEDNINEDSQVSKKDIYKIALLLPLYLNDIESIDINLIKSNADLSNIKSLGFIHFYEGFLMALDSMKKSGMKAEVYVYDITEDTTRMRALLQKTELKQMDLIIGPIFGNNFKIATQFALKNKIPIVNPFSSRNGIVKNNPYVFKIIPSDSIISSYISSYITDSLPESNIIFIANDQKNINDKYYRDAIKNDAIKKNIKTLTISNNVCKSYESDCVNKNIKTNKANIFLCNFEGEVAVSNFVRYWQEKRDTLAIVFASTNWGLYDNIEIEYFLKLNLHITETFFIDYNDTLVKIFGANFMSKFSTEPNEIAFQAYDIGMFFMKSLYENGVNFPKFIKAYDGLTSRFVFQQNKANNGYENNYINLFKYKDYKILNVRKNYKTKEE